MRDSSWNIDLEPLRGLYRDADNAWICGVCAGLADRFEFRLSTVRIIAVISLVLFFWLTAAIYLGATLLLKEKPLIYSGSRTEYEFWRRRDRDDWSHS
jgi:phage shock protein PspC (stress-responsive transcriptional regulator)